MDPDEPQPSRRKFMAISAASMAALAGTPEHSLQTAPEEDGEVRAAAFLIGPESAIPAPDSGFFDDKSRYHYLYFAIDGGRYEIREGDGEWSQLEVSAPQTNIGEHTEIFESSEGSTVLRNTAGNPINIQLYPSGRAYMNENTTETVIDTQNEWVPIQGAWKSAHLNYLDHDGNGGLVYRGDVTSQTQYMVGGTYVSPSNNAEYEIAMFKDETIKERTIMDFSPPRQDEALSLPSVFGFTDTTTTDMSHQPRVRCTNGATNVTVRAMNFTLRG